jgi:uncharacterized protein YegP (UPF0339 family)
MKIQFYEDEAGETRFRFVAKNGEIIVPPEGYKNRKDCEHCVETIRTAFLTGDVEIEYLY